MPKKHFKSPPPSILGRVKFHNRLTPEMAERHAVNVKMRNDRMDAEKAANHRTEYNIMVGHQAKQHPYAKAAACEELQGISWSCAAEVVRGKTMRPESQVCKFSTANY